MEGRFQLTTDGFKPYAQVVEAVFGKEIDYGQLVKIYGTVHGPTGRYSPAECIGARAKKIIGNPDEKHISTSFAERNNLNIRIALSPHDAVDECLFKEGREPRARDGAALSLLQFRAGYTIQPSSLALSLASLQALARNCDTVIGARGSSLSEMSFASNWGALSGL